MAAKLNGVPNKVRRSGYYLHARGIQYIAERRGEKQDSRSGMYEGG